ncbi:MAG: PilZ domain-containing protein [Alphaproteobacteria bacterium]
MGTMFQSLLTKTKAGTGTSTPPRRQYERRNVDVCVGMIDGKNYPIENWSPGGVLFNADSSTFPLQKEVDVTLKFRMRNEIVDVRHKAKVIRKSINKIAFEFLPLTNQIKKKFQSVIDDHVAAEFVESQLI